MSGSYSNMKITEYEDFLSIVEEVGFMPLSNNNVNFVNLSDLTQEEQWHTGLASDPWQWRVRIEEEGKAAYAKLFDKKPGFISLEWYPTFLAARRKRRNFEEIYAEGLISSYAKNIYDLFKKHDNLAVFEIKSLAGFSKDLNSKYESALTELQMSMFITIDGTKRKISAAGDPYGWPAAAYSTVEKWAGEELIQKSKYINPKDAADEIIERISEVSENQELRKIIKFAGI